MIKQIVLACSLAFFMCLGSGKLSAQCKYKVISVLNDTSSYTIPCDFPIKVKTGDTALDQSRFNTVFTDWNLKNPAVKATKLPTLGTTGIKKVFFEISIVDLQHLSPGAKNMILASPELYLIKQ